MNFSKHFKDPSSSFFDKDIVAMVPTVPTPAINVYIPQIGVIQVSVKLVKSSGVVYGGKTVRVRFEELLY